ncbi:MAG TPA: cupin domain-containing protein [Thermoanaerobaculia bacterium]
MTLSMERLLEPFSFRAFYRAWYEKKPLLIKRRSPAFYASLLTLDDVNEHLGRAHLSAPPLRLARNGEEIDYGDYTYPSSSANSHWSDATVDKELLFAKFYDGYTIILMEYEQHSAAMLRLRHEVERAFHSSVRTHVYLTPRNAQGFSPHWDPTNVFILQFTGTKEWAIYDSPVTLPTDRQLLYPGEWTRVEPTLTATLEPGDLLYIPRGFVHEGRSGNSVSGHVTLEMRALTWADLLRRIADGADADPWLRRPLPIGYRGAAPDDEFLRHVHEFFDNADLSSYVEKAHEEFAGDCLPDATDRLADYVNLPWMDAGSRLQIRSGVCHELSAGGKTVLTFDRKRLEFPASAAPSLRFMMKARQFSPRGLPGGRAANLALCRTLVREGFLAIAGSPA